MIVMIAGFILGSIITILILTIKNYLKINHLELEWKNIFIALVIFSVIIYLIYSFIGITIGPMYEKTNGNVCKGYKYGWKICSGDINAE